jgi:hypothetical protein
MPPCHHQHVVDGIGTAVNTPITQAGAAIGESALQGPGVGVNVRRQQDQGESVAPIERQLLHAAVCNHLAEGPVFGVDHWRFSSDLHRFRDRADFQMNVDLRLLIDFQNNAGVHRFLEAAAFHADLVVAYVERRRGIKSVRIGLGVDGVVGVHVDDGYLRVGNSSAGRISDRA